jgi:exodeoxyribonuclease VII small subunit
LCSPSFNAGFIIAATLLVPDSISGTGIIMAVKKKAADFEQSLNALEALVNKMEQGDMTLEESLQAFATGIQLTRECQTRLAEAEQKVSLLIEQQGQITLTEFDASDDE